MTQMIRRNTKNQERAIIIRKFEPDDLQKLLEVDRAAFGGHNPILFMTFYESGPETFLVAEEDGKILGFVIGFKQSSLEGKIFWLAVKPGYQNQGIGTRLMINLLEIFRELGVIGATLEVRISNSQAQALYAALGFDTISLSPFYYSDGEAAIIMRKLLKPSRLIQHRSLLS
jgi:ribosomal-protein-alanine N-acetyltransferase